MNDYDPVIAIGILMHAHYYLMKYPRYWADSDLREADAMLCVRASDIRVELRKQRGAA